MFSQDMDADKRLNLLIQAGELLLESGAPTYRVEETLKRIGEVLALPNLEVVATPTWLIIEARDFFGCLTRTKRIGHLGVDMNRISAVNNLSRQAVSASFSADQIATGLTRIAQQKSLYPHWLIVMGVGVSCGAFSGLLGGGWREFLAATLGASLAMLIRYGLRSARLIPLMVTVSAAFGATVASWLGCRLLACTAPNVATIASVLQLVPGVPLVTALIDLATGDILSSVARGAYAMLIAAGIALGMLLFLVWGVL